MFIQKCKKIALGCLLLLLTLPATPLLAAQPAFSLTPEAEKLFRDMGSVGYLYWKDYRGC